MDVLPMELLTSILTLLPPKSVCRFKCVSKTWNSLISSADFVKLHLNQSLSTKNRFLVINSLTHGLRSLHFKSDNQFKVEMVNRIEIPLPFSTTEDIVRILGSSNGLIALSCEYPDDSLFVDIVLFNPSINSYFSVPHYNPPKSTFTMSGRFSFGYDSLNDDYKIVKMTDYLANNSEWLRDVDVYNLRDNCWKTVLVESTNDMSFESFYGFALINNIIYYIFNAYLENNPLLRGFDLASYKWSEIDLPEFEGHEMKRTDIASLGELNERLCVVSAVLPRKEGAYVWVMKEYGVWSKLFDVNDAINVGALDGAPIWCSNGGDEVILKKQDEDGLYCYNIRSKVIKPVTAICNRCYIRDVFLCVESLVSANNMIGVGNEDADKFDL
ncbi:unnamed protein product [Amaranthus hypochondriacus]